MKILVTGANGLLGSQLVKKLAEKSYDLHGVGKGPSRVKATGNNFSYHQVDILDGKAIYDLILSVRPQVIVHAAAMTQVDECEVNKIDCWNINVTATRFIVDAAKEISSRLIYVSTDFVFDGTSGPYSEGDLPNPVNYYGSSKWGGEKAIEESGLDWLVVRTVLVYGKTDEGQRPNIISWVKSNLEKGEKIKVVDDQVRTPTFVEDLANGIILAMERNAKGILHISGSETLTPYQMAVATAEHLGFKKSLIEKVDGSSFRQIAERPPRTGFIIEKARREVGFEPRSFKESLEEIFGARTEE